MTVDMRPECTGTSSRVCRGKVSVRIVGPGCSGPHRPQRSNALNGPLDMLAGVVDVRAQAESAGGRSGDAKFFVHRVEECLPLLGCHLHDAYAGAEFVVEGCSERGSDRSQRLLEEQREFTDSLVYTSGPDGGVKSRSLSDRTDGSVIALSHRLRQPDIVNFRMLHFSGFGFPFLFPGRSYERSVSWLTASSAATARGRSRPCGAGGWVCRRRDRRRRHQGSACRQSSRWLRACSRHGRWGWLAGAGRGGPRDRSRQRVSRSGQ